MSGVPTLVVLALLLAAPLAAAEWRVQGSVEPDTPIDAEGGLMTTQPDVDPNPNVHKLYFQVSGTAYVSGMNPNSAETGSRMYAPPYDKPAAWLGVWKDCNGDGYVGHAAAALSEYPTHLLGAGGVCPAGVPSDHNDGAYVYELFWIVPRADNRMPRAWPDASVRVWGDIGYPGEDTLSHLEECGLFPSGTITDVATSPQRGDTASTGGMVRYADCWTGRNVANALALDPTGALAFEDPGHPEASTSLLNQPLPAHPWGNPRGENGYEPGLYDTGEQRETGAWNPAFTVWDCDDPSGTAGISPGVDPQVHDPMGNYYAAAHHTYEGAPILVAVPSPTGQSCATHDPPLAIIDPNPEVDQPVPHARRTNDMKFWWHDASAPPTFETPHEIFPEIPEATTPQLPPNGGQGVLRPTGLGGPVWSSGPENLPPRLIQRSSLQPEGAFHLTFYAAVGPATLARATAPGVGVYGSEWCAGATGEVRNFDCDASRWDEGADVDASGRPDGAAPGHAYHARDVDCKDLAATRLAPSSAAVLSERGACPGL